MINRQLVAGLLICLCCTEALAVQLGQLSSYSRLGEPLIARIDLYGAQTDQLTLEQHRHRSASDVIQLARRIALPDDRGLGWEYASMAMRQQCVDRLFEGGRQRRHV